MLGRRALLKLAGAFGATQVIAAPALAQSKASPPAWAAKLIEAGRRQLGVTTVYDPAYVQLAYPNGDVPRERGVCTDVVIRAYRDAFGMDLQQLVHEDMKANFVAYPKNWGLKRPDRNIDHRRVPNLETFFQRKGWAQPLPRKSMDFRPGDIVSQRLPGGLPHIGIVSDKMNRDGAHPLVIHNIGAGAREEDVLYAFKINSHFRAPPTA